MDFLSLLTSSDNLIQLGYVAILIFAAVVLLPRLLHEHAKEREAFLALIKETNDKFIEVIDSYKDALTDFQQKEDEAHSNLVQMIVECRTNVASEHKELMRALKAIAKKLDADIIE